MLEQRWHLFTDYSSNICIAPSEDTVYITKTHSNNGLRTAGVMRADVMRCHLTENDVKSAVRYFEIHLKMSFACYDFTWTFDLWPSLCRVINVQTFHIELRLTTSMSPNVYVTFTWSPPFHTCTFDNCFFFAPFCVVYLCTAAVSVPLRIKVYIGAITMCKLYIHWSYL